MEAHEATRKNGCSATSKPAPEKSSKKEHLSLWPGFGQAMLPLAKSSTEAGLTQASPTSHRQTKRAPKAPVLIQTEACVRKRLPITFGIAIFEDEGKEYSDRPYQPNRMPNNPPSSVASVKRVEVT